MAITRAAASDKGKGVVISISDSDDDDYEEEEEEEEESEYEEEEVSDYAGDDANDSDEDDGDGDDSGRGKPTEEERYNKVVHLLQSRKCLDVLKLEDCKAYLRKHELRLCGTKATCIERILEHWRIKDGSSDKFYPRSSFTIDCTGDVCKGDVVLFRQRVYKEFDKARRGASIIGKRTIAGRVVKESYGAVKQQHTFTVEVLWSKGVKALPPLFPLLVKGRNLYRLKTFRQCWKNEAERSKVLAEKHKRGAAARHARETTKAKFADRGSSFQTNFSDAKQYPKKRGKKQFEHSSKRRKQDVPSAKSQPDAHEKIMRLPLTRNPSSSERNPRPARCPEREVNLQHPFSQRIPFQWNCNILPESHYMTKFAPPHRNIWNYNALYHNQSHHLDFTGSMYHPALSMRHVVSHPYLNATSHLDPRGSNHLQRPPAFNHGSALPSNVQFHRRP